VHLAAELAGEDAYRAVSRLRGVEDRRAHRAAVVVVLCRERVLPVEAEDPERRGEGDRGGAPVVLERVAQEAAAVLAEAEAQLARDRQMLVERVRYREPWCPGEPLANTQRLAGDVQRG